MKHVVRKGCSKKWQNLIVSSTGSHLVSTRVKLNFRVPLTIADVHLRNEQLAFAYYFPITLSQDNLLASLSNVLPQFPVLGGSIPDGRFLSIDCTTADTISCTFCYSDEGKSYWLKQRNILRRQQSPELLPLFSPLPIIQENLATLRITTLEDGSTVIGMVVSHIVADAASCFHFLNQWGDEMHVLTSKKHKDNNNINNNNINNNNIDNNNINNNNNDNIVRIPQSNDRAMGTCSGMMTPKVADIMGLVIPVPTWTDRMLTWMSLDGNADKTLLGKVQFDPEQDSDHQYIHMEFETNVLAAMKAHGMKHAKHRRANDGGAVDYVSINDMLTAFGWLMKRELSSQSDASIAIVVNLRGRCGIDTLGDNGLFGNGITHINAQIPECATNEEHLQYQLSIESVSAAAFEIRKSMLEELQDMPDRLGRSRLGEPPRKVNYGNSFSTTAWGAFPIWDIKFGEGAHLVGFHGQPAHPMPPGEMFASIIVPNQDVEELTYQLLCPKYKVNQARAIHTRLSSLFLEWHSSAKAEEAIGTDHIF